MDSLSKKGPLSGHDAQSNNFDKPTLMVPSIAQDLIQNISAVIDARLEVVTPDDMQSQPIQWKCLRNPDQIVE